VSERKKMISFYAPAGLVDLIDQLAEASGYSKADILRRCLEKYEPDLRLALKRAKGRKELF